MLDATLMRVRADEQARHLADAVKAELFLVRQRVGPQARATKLLAVDSSFTCPNLIACAVERRITDFMYACSPAGIVTFRRRSSYRDGAGQTHGALEWQ